MIDWGFTDLQQLWEPENTSHTWENKRSSSRIDYIWGSKEIALNLLNCRNDNIAEVTNSDHTLITIQIPCDTILRCPNKYTRNFKIKYEKVINTNKTTTAQWNKFSQKVDQKLFTKHINDRILKIDLTNEEEINFTIQNTWKDFESTLIATAFNHLYCEKKTSRSISHNKKTGQSKTESHILQIYHKTLKIVRS
jgi:hypothetical protein